jgi:DNA-binding MarR family transcriptional regulator
MNQQQPEPRWLSPDELRAWMTLAGVMVRLPAALDAQLQRDNGLSMFEYFVLSGLSMAENHTSRMSDLAEFTNGSLSRLSNVVKRLEQRGAVRREPAPENGRYINAILTAHGWDLVEAAAPGHVEAVRRLIFDVLAPEQVTSLGEIGDRVLANLEPPSAWLSPSNAGALLEHDPPAPPGQA